MITHTYTIRFRGRIVFQHTTKSAIEKAMSKIDLGIACPNGIPPWIGD